MKNEVGATSTCFSGNEFIWNYKTLSLNENALVYFASLCFLNKLDNNNYKGLLSASFTKS